MKRQVTWEKFQSPLFMGKSCKIIPDKEKDIQSEEIQKKLAKTSKQFFKRIEGKKVFKYRENSVKNTHRAKKSLQVCKKGAYT